jgi:hypothetical protein
MAEVIANLLLNGLNPVTVGGTGTAIKYFPNVPGASIGVASTKNGYLYCPGVGKANAQRLSVRASGNFTIGNLGGGSNASPAVTVGLYPVTFSGNTPAGTPTIGSAVISQIFAAASDLIGYYPFALSADVQGDNTSGIVQSLAGNIVIDGTPGSFSTTAILSSVNMLAPVPFAFVVGVTFSVSDSLASANLYQFDLQQ